MKKHTLKLPPYVDCFNLWAIEKLEQLHITSPTQDQIDMMEVLLRTIKI